MIRTATGEYARSGDPPTGLVFTHFDSLAKGVFCAGEVLHPQTIANATNAQTSYSLAFDIGRVMPVGNAVKTRAWGALACVYLGAPR